VRRAPLSALVSCADLPRSLCPHNPQFAPFRSPLDLPEEPAIDHPPPPP
jgi:hypothetical protein